jgi:superfamily II DNA or RNA helicase
MEYNCMMLAVRCKSSFDSGVRTRGHRYFRQRRVSFVDEQPQELHAAVQGDTGTYGVVINWQEIENGPIRVSCTCPYFSGGSRCKHIWATLLEMDMVGMHVSIPGKQAVKVRGTDEPVAAPLPNTRVSRRGKRSVEEASARGPGARMRSVDGITNQDRATSTGPTAPSWEHLIQQVSVSTSKPKTPLLGYSSLPRYRRGERRILYCLNVSTTVRQNRLQIDLFESIQKKTGEYSKPRRLSLNASEIEQLESETDRELLQLLVGATSERDRAMVQRSYLYAAPRFSSVTVRSLLGEALLPRLCATGRLSWLLDTSLSLEESRPVQWRDASWRFRLHVTAKAESSAWELHGEFTQGDRVAALQECTLVTQDGWLLVHDELARMESAEAWPWIELLRREGPIVIPHGERERLLKSLCALPGLPELKWPESWQLDAVCLTPRGQLMLKSPDSTPMSAVLLGEVLFEYGDHVFHSDASDSAAWTFDQQQLIRRNPQLEEQLWQQLFDQGVALHDSLLNKQTERQVQVASGRFVEIVERLTQLGWTVCSAGRQLRRPGKFSLNVTSGLDWFDLSGDVDFDGVSASLASVLRALRGGQTIVKLDDGSHGMLPENWLHKYLQLAELGQQEGDSLRFAPSQTLLLDALLSEQDEVRIDQQFAAFRRQLKSFSGIKAARPPRGFRGELRPYQLEGLGWLKFLQKFRLGGCLADDMGLGKTIQVLALLESRRTRPVESGGTRKPSLVVVPKSLVFNWLDEAQRFAPRLRVFNYTGIDRAERWESERAEHEIDVIVTTYGTIRRDIMILREMAFDYVILDESQAIKNHQSLAAKACRLLPAEHRLAMTGTPIENHIGELWSLFEFLNPGMLGRSSAYANLTEGDIDPESLQRLAQGIRPFLLRRTKQQVLTDLPEKTEQTLRCKLPPKQKKLYEDLRDYFRVQLNQRLAADGLERSKIHVLEALLRLRQAACHPGLIEPKRTGEMGGKLEVLFEQLDAILAEGHKALVFSQFTSLLAIVQRHLDERSWQYEYLDGRTRDRAARVRRFQEDASVQLFLVSLKAGGQGLNLTAADYVFILDPWWNPAVEAQAVDRAHRMGQQKPVFAYRLISEGTVEEKILQLQQSKRELADAIVSADSSLIRNLTAEDLQLLLS